MSEKTLPFVITDRRKFNSEGEPRPDADPSPEREARPELKLDPTPEAPTAEAPAPEEAAAAGSEEEPGMPPPPTAEQMEQSRLAFEATADRLDTAIRAANPGADHPPALTFESLIQSVYMQAIMQLGGGTQDGQQPQVDLLGARQSIDMLGILNAKSAGNLNETEKSLLDSAIFELRLAFLEITQALARSAQQRAQQQGPGGAGPTPGRPGPSIVR
jgi:hypothetical protein